jgi:hypothetical protein
MTPEQLIQLIKGRKLKITPIVEIMGKSGSMRVACDCSGCNNPKIAIDMFRSPVSGAGKGPFEGGKVRGYLVLEEETVERKMPIKAKKTATRKTPKRNR